MSPIELGANGLPIECDSHGSGNRQQAPQCHLSLALSHEADAHADKFRAEKDATYNRMTDEFIERFCDAQYYIDWPKLVRFVSENMSSGDRAPLLQAAKRAT